MPGNLLNMTASLRGSSTISEVSSISGRGSLPGNSREELQELRALLGMSDLEEIHQNYFRVDRKKMEQMILGESDSVGPPDVFFLKIMDETSTVITWPSKMKIGAKSKKDPTIRVSGRAEDVKIAKEKILAHLETKRYTVIMKLDVSYTDHSHIIGKGGLCIKRVMDETQCHIHFPDSNRSNSVEKSNQVSIAGDIVGVERARAQIRNLTPLIFSFELPIMDCAQAQPNANSSYVLHISQQFNVQVMFRTRPKLHATLVLVKGTEWEVQKVKEATILLINHMCESVANQTLVQMTMEISPIHHAIVRGRSSANLKAIMQGTGTQIMFPEISDPNIAPIKKSNVTIIGVIHNVYLARQQLMGSLPMVIMFDLPEALSNVRAEFIAHLMSAKDVFINLRQKPKQSILSVIIKGIERNATNMYEARNQLLNLDEPRVVADIPRTYFLPEASRTFGIDYNANSKSFTSTFNSFQNSFPHTSWTQNTTPGQVPTTSSLFSFPENVHSNMYFNTNSTLSPLGTTANNISSQMNTNSSLGASPCSFENSTKDSGFISTNGSDQSSPTTSPGLRLNLPSSSGTMNLASMLSDVSESLSSPSWQTLDYEQRRVAAARAVKAPIFGCRVPNNSWAGYGLSATSPSILRSAQSPQMELVSKQYDNIWTQSSSPSMTNSKIQMTTPESEMNKAADDCGSALTGDWQDLGSLLMAFELEKYIKVFASHEIDLATFTTLSDKDLIEIGITAFGARRKMMLVITELSKRSRPFSGSAAPGAERKVSPIQYSAGTSDQKK